MVRENVTFTFRIDSAKAQQTLRQLEAQVKSVGGAMVKTGADAQNMGTKIKTSSNNVAASAINFQTGTQGMLNLSTAAVQTFTSISNLDRANNRAKMSVIAVARAEDLLNNKLQRRNEMQEAGTTGGMKYANIQREIATAEADLTVKIEKKGIEQAAVNDIYMLFATNIANVTISSMQTIAILDKNQILLTKGKAVAQKILNTSMISGIRTSYALTVATQLQGRAAVVTTGATVGLTLAVKSFMIAAWPLLAVMVALTAAFAIHESNILGTKTALDKLIGVEKDFESQVKEGRDGVEEYDESLGKLNSTVGSSLPNSFESATKVMIAYTNSLKENTSIVERNVESQIKLHSFIASGQRGVKPTLSTIQTEVKPQVSQGFASARSQKNFSSGGITTQPNEALASALSWSLFIMPQAHADRGDNVDRVIIPKEVKPQVESRRGKIFTSSAIAAAAQPTPESLQGDQTPMFKEGAEMSNQFTLSGHSGGVSNIPAVADLAKELGVSVESLEGSLSTGEFSIKQLQIANQILSGDLMTIKHVKDFVESTKFKQFTPELESDRLALEKAKDQDKNFASIFRERYMASGVSIDKTLNELGKLEGDRKKRLDSKNLTFVDGIGFDLTSKVGLKEHQKYLQAKLGKFIPTVDPLKFAGIKDKQDEITGKQYLRFLAGQGLNDSSSFIDNQYSGTVGGYSFAKSTEAFGKIINNKGTTSNVILNKNQNRLLAKIQNGEISGNRAEVLLELGIDIGNAANNYSIDEAMRIGALQTQAAGFQGLGGQGAAAIRAVGGNATAAYQVPKGSIATPRHIMTAISHMDSFANGIGRYLLNLTSALTGDKRKRTYRNKFGRKDKAFLSESGETIQQALEFGFRENEDFINQLNESLVDVDPRSAGAVGRAKQNVKTSVAISEQFLAMQFNMLRGIGIESTSIAAIAGEIGFNGELPAGFINNAHLLSQMSRSDFNNFDIIHESKSKLNMSNQEVFAIRFNAKRGDDELLDRIRFQDRLDAMSSGTSAF